MLQQVVQLNFYEFISKKMLNYLSKYLKLKQLEYEKLFLGIMILTINILEFSIIFTISFFMGIIKEIIIFSIMFASLRCVAAGIHCKSSLMCIITTSISYIGSVYISINYSLNIYFNLIIIIICMTLLYKYAPADTENRPILGEEHRKKLKFITMIMATILIIINLLLLNKTLFNLTMFVFIIETISVLPCTYKFTKKSYNNYEKYNIV